MTTRNNHELHIRRATEHDIPVIWEILKGEIEVMRRAGRDQWQYGYPNPDTVASDIEIGQGWVLLSGAQVVGYCAFITAGDPCSDHIWDGEWLTDSNSTNSRYTVVHRLGIDHGRTRQGLASAFLLMLIDESKRMGRESMRIDTNFDNLEMLHILPKIGFTRCGMIMVKDGERNSFEKVF